MSINTNVLETSTATKESEKLNQINEAITTLTAAKTSIAQLNEIAEISQDISSILSKLELLKAQESCNLEHDQDEDIDPPVTEPEPPVTEPEVPVTPPVNNTIKYAPQLKPVSGSKDLCCIGLKWKDNAGPALSSVTNACNMTAKTYNDLSNGVFKFNTASKIIEVNQLHKPANLNAAEKEARNKANASRKAGSKPFDLFAIVHSKVRGFSNAGGNTAHLYGTLPRDFYHEIGHLKPFSLGHAGIYDDKGKLLAYNDGSSFMGKFSSDKLTAPQLYSLGWLAEKKVALHDLNAPATEYKFERLFDKKGTDSVKAVMIPTEGRPLFVSYIPYNDKKTKQVKNAFALHLRSAGGSQRATGLFGQTAEYNGFVFERTSTDLNYPTMRISQKSK